MLATLAGRARRIASLLVVLVLCGAVLPAALHDGLNDDPYCDPPAASGGRSVWSSAGAAADATHCDVCHWLRSIRSYEMPPVVLGFAAGSTVSPSPDSLTIPPAPSAALAPARAPPA